MEAANGSSDRGDIAVVKHFEGHETFTFSFVLRNDELNIDRQFNMQRPLTETCQQFVSRLNANVDKVVAKKMKKKQKRRKLEGAEEGGDAETDGKVLAILKKRCGSDLGSDDSTKIQA